MREHNKGVKQGIGAEGCKLPAPLGLNALPLFVQSIVFIGVFAMGFVGTYQVLSIIDYLEYDSFTAPYLKELKASWAPTMGLAFATAGILHFVPSVRRNFENIMPYWGAWGIWYLPGSPRFHVAWTGVAEFAGGFGMFISSFPQYMPEYVQQFLSVPLPAFCLMLLVIAMTPGNIFMLTHGARMPINAPSRPLKFHLLRGAIQCLILAILYTIAEPITSVVKEYLESKGVVF